MDLLSSIEGRIDKWFGRIFAHRGGRQGIQPVAIAKEAVKAMDGMRQVSIDAVYVPNHFDVRLHPFDYTLIEPVQLTVVRDCVAFVVRTAKRRGLSFAGPVEVKLTVDESILQGELRVVASFREEGRLPTIDADTARYVATPSVPSIEQPTFEAQSLADTGTRRYLGLGLEVGRESSRWLEVQGGPEPSRLSLIPGKTYTIGRADDNDLQLDDSRVSRYHARLVYEDGGWWIEDLQTTNGTRRNGATIRRARLQGGDELSVGLTMMRYMEREQ